MKEIDQDKLCRTCIGCNRLEQENFNGVYRCNNYAKGLGKFERTKM